MTLNEQAYINGFVKRASEYGVNENDAIQLLKQSNALTRAIQSGKVSPGAAAKYFESSGAKYGPSTVQAILDNPHGLNMHPTVKMTDTTIADIGNTMKARQDIAKNPAVSDFAKKQEALRIARLMEKERLERSQLQDLHSFSEPMARKDLVRSRSHAQHKQPDLNNLNDIQKEILRVQGRKDFYTPPDFYGSDYLARPYKSMEQPLIHPRFENLRKV